MMKAWLIAAAGAASLMAGCATPPPDQTQAPGAPADPMAPTSAPGYMAMAASSDMFEIESSRLALQASRDGAVRQFAQMMINDHGRTTSEMMAIAQQQGLAPPPPQMMPHHAEMLERLRSAAPGGFEAAYKREQIMAHQEALNLHRTYAAQGDNEAFRAFAARTVPAIEMHYGHAQSLPEMAMAPQPMPMEQAPPPAAGERG
jgi:putative membrane protein